MAHRNYYLSDSRNLGMHPEVKNAYLNSIYHILPCHAFPEGYDIYIDDRHKSLDYWLEKQGYNEWVFMTAWNPDSEPLPLTENLNRNKRLLSDVRNLKFKAFDALGKAPDETWMEVSIFIPGMGLEEAQKLANKYEQRAFVYGQYKRKAELRMST